MVWAHPKPSQSAADPDEHPPGSYVVVNGLRYVVPYERTQRLYLQDKYIGMTVQNCVSSLFGAQTEENRSMWEQEIDAGRVLLRRRKARASDPETQFLPCALTDLVQKQDQVTILRHVHEAAVPAAEPRILYEDARLVGVEKVRQATSTTDRRFPLLPRTPATPPLATLIHHVTHATDRCRLVWILAAAFLNTDCGAPCGLR
jgi:hypothetical protein